MTSDPEPQAAAPPVRRNISHVVHGRRRELPGGGWVRVVTRVNNFRMVRKRRELEAAYRAGKGLPDDAPIPALDSVEITLRAMFGTALMDWGGIADVDDADRDLAVTEDNAALLLLAPETSNEIEDVLSAEDALAKRNVEAVSGNSEVPSDGSAPTDGTDPN